MAGEMRYLDTVTVSADVTESLKLEVDVRVYARRLPGSKHWDAIWNTESDPSLEGAGVRWVGPPDVVSAVETLCPARQWWMEVPRRNPIADRLEKAANDAAERAVLEWEEEASSPEASPANHDRDTREDAAE